MEILNSGVAGYLIIAMMAMAVSMAVIPIMVKLAPVIGMIDTPDARKVHKVPIPRVGGIGIVLGALLPMLIWLTYSDLTISIFIGAFILLIFGTWDDISELGHYIKFAGQFVAAGVVVYYGDLYVSYFPLNSYEVIPESIGRPFTIIAIVGMINAINHSDGLDGLAGGESIISLAMIAYLAFLFDSELLLVMACASIGGIFGFLRFNSYPARVFMGDGGSQFIGYILAILVLLLTQNVNTTLSPALPVLLLGLPIVDILAVFYLRAKHKMNLFKATRNHIHHRLLDMGFLHSESVIAIYSVQLLLVLSAVPLMYALDFYVLLYYFFICASLFLLITISERRGYVIHGLIWWFRQKESIKSKKISLLIRGKSQSMKDIPLEALVVGLSLFIIAPAFVVKDVPTDFAISSLILGALLLFVLATGFLENHLYRLILFTTIGFSVYLLTSFPVEWLSDQLDVVFIYFILMTILSVIAVKSSSHERFNGTPLDYLVIVIAIIIAVFPSGNVFSNHIWMIVQIILLFYVAELVIQNMSNIMNRFTGIMLLALALIAYRGLA